MESKLVPLERSVFFAGAAIGRMFTTRFAPIERGSHVIVCATARAPHAARTEADSRFSREHTHSSNGMSLATCSSVPVRASAGRAPGASASSKSAPASSRRALAELPRRALSLAAATAAALAVGAGAPDLPRALAIPQTSECATNSCDDADYSNRDLTDQYYTKGSVKRANFRNSNLAGVTLFGADLTEADFTGADLTNANIGQCNLTGTIFKDANLSGAIVSGANMDDVGDIDGSDWSDVIVRKDVNDKLCAKKPQGLNPATGNPTAMTLFCD